ncbi:MAG: hypothetical protein RLZ09_933 [Pseudomonadota bacterium]|jgi:hypothetical protein
MKALVMIGLVTMTSMAMATVGGGGGSPTSQTSVIVNTSVMNTSDGMGSASEQNLASNAGTFTSSNTQDQTVSASGFSTIVNDSSHGGHATQNIASNAGGPGLYTTTHQLAVVTSSAVINRATNGSQAVQNISSNTNCITCLNSMSDSHH